MDSVLETNFLGVKFKNPLIAASGIVGYGEEYEKFFPLETLGGISVKGTTKNERLGNKGPRIAETPAGMLNSVGLENPGIDVFIKDKLQYLLKKDVVILANIAGSTEEEYEYIAEKLNKTKVHMIELNISCPNVKKGGLGFGSNPKSIYNIVSRVRKKTSKQLIVKLSPNVESIIDCSKAAEAAGANALTIINTILGMKIDINTKRPVLKNNVGGLSGACLLPIAVRMVWQAKKNVSIPIIGCGGIYSFEDALEIIMAGASLFEVGTAFFSNPTTPIDILTDLKNWLIKNNIKNINELCGSVIEW